MVQHSTCCVAGCSKNKVKGISNQMFRVPSVIHNQGEVVKQISERRRFQWFKNIYRKDIDISSNKRRNVCSRLFLAGKPSNMMMEGEIDWAPTQNMGHTILSTYEITSNMERNNRYVRRRRKHLNAPEQAAALIITDQEELDSDLIDVEMDLPSKKTRLDDSAEDPFQSNQDTLIHSVEIDEASDERKKTRLGDSAEDTFQSNQEILIQSVEIDEASDESTDDFDLLLMDIGELRHQLRNARKKISKQSSYLLNLSVILAEKDKEIVDLEFNLGAAMKNNENLQNEVDQFKPHSTKFLSSDEKVKYYTGLPSYKHFESLLRYLHPDQVHGNSSLSKEMQLLVVFMKLRLSLRHKDLAYRFGVHKSTITRCVMKWIYLMFIKLKPLIVRAWEWAPTNEEMKKTVPMCFRKAYPNIKVILDCFEIFCNAPKALIKKVGLFSNYKFHTTIKCLLGITSHGCVNFLSKPFSGRVSDKEIVLESGLLQQLEEGDEVMAERGFVIHDLMTAVGAKLVTPHLKGRNPQLSGLQVEESREVANVRIHIERVIGLGKNAYSILQGPLKPYTLKCDDNGTSFVEKITTVCFTLVNLLPPIIPSD